MSVTEADLERLWREANDASDLAAHRADSFYDFSYYQLASDAWEYYNSAKAIYDQLQVLNDDYDVTDAEAYSKQHTNQEGLA